MSWGGLEDREDQMSYREEDIPLASIFLVAKEFKDEIFLFTFLKSNSNKIHVYNINLQTGLLDIQIIQFKQIL